MRVRYFYAIFVPERTTFLKTGHKLITDAEHPLTFKHKNKHHEHDNRTNKQNDSLWTQWCSNNTVRQAKESSAKTIGKWGINERGRKENN